MSTTDLETMTEPWDELDASRLGQTPRGGTPIVPKELHRRPLARRRGRHHDLPGGATAGAAMLVVSGASDWQSDVGREVTIQVRPVPGHDIEADVRKAAGDRPRRPASPTCSLTPRKNPPSWSSPGSAPASTSTNCRSRA